MAAVGGSAQGADDSLKTGGPYVPTPQVVVDSMLRMAAVFRNSCWRRCCSRQGLVIARMYKLTA